MCSLSDLLFVLSTFGLPFALYWVLGLAFYRVDVTKRPAWLAKRKLQAAVISSSRIAEVCRASLVAQVQALCGLLALAPWLRTVLPADNPSAAQLAAFVAPAILVQEVWFYYFHRLFHAVPQLYQLHKKHHEFANPTALVAPNAHWLENVCVNAAPILVSTVWLRPHAQSLLAFLVWATLQTSLDHSGYRVGFPFGDNGHHDDHHKYRDVNFGSGWLDALHGTQRRKSQI